MKRVVVTGIGAVSPAGNTFHESWEAAKTGVSGIAPITRVDVTGIKWKVAGELKGFETRRYLSAKEMLRLDPFVHYAVAAAVMAAKDAGVTEEPPEGCIEAPVGQRCSLMKVDAAFESAGVIIGSSRGGISSIEMAVADARRVAAKRAGHQVSAYLMPSTTISMAPSYVALKLGLRGYCLGISNACASGTSAIGEAYRLIRSGYPGPVFCGGTEAPLCRICLEGYGASGALSRVSDSSASRPFDRTRDGFVLSEGSCILVLEDYDRALRRGARIYGEIIGYGNTTDGMHQTIPSPEGEARAIKMAMEEAGVGPQDVHLISAHGTSTPLGDKTETKAIKLATGRYAYEIPVTSLKSVTGHMLAASGSLEAAFTFLSMSEGIIPPTMNLRERDPECDLDYVAEPREAEIGCAISQSFGFGGVNAVLVFKKP